MDFPTTSTMTSITSTTNPPDDPSASKKARVDDNKTVGDDNHNETVMMTDGDGAEEEDNSNDSNTEENGDQGDGQWEAVVEEIRASSDEDCKAELKKFLQGLRERQAAKDGLQVFYDKVFAKELPQNHLLEEDTSTQSFLWGAIIFFKDVSDSMEETNQSIQHYLLQNHGRRKNLLARMMATQAHGQQLVDRIENPAAPTDGSLDTDKQADDGTADDGTADDGTANSAGDSEDDWNQFVRELKEQGPAGCQHLQAVHTFLQGVERWQAAHDRFLKNIDEIHAELEALLDKTEDIFVDAVEQLMDPVDQQQQEIQTHLANNFKGRAKMEQAIADAAQQQQSKFSELMAGLGMGFGGGGSQQQP